MSLETDCVDEVIKYQSNDADKSILLPDRGKIKAYRAYYLKNLRFDWEWVDSDPQGKPYVLLKRR